MKSILVGKLKDTKVYYVVDSVHKDADCVLVGRLGGKKVTNFWEFVDWNKDVRKIQNTHFHEYLWNGHQSKSGPHWYSVFVEKSLPIDHELLDGTVVNEDILGRRQKVLQFENRAMDFSVSLNSQNVSSKTLASWSARKIVTQRKKRGRNNE